MDSSTSGGQNRNYTMVAQDKASPGGSLTTLAQRSAQVMNQLLGDSVKRQEVTGNRICGPDRQKTISVSTGPADRGRNICRFSSRHPGARAPSKTFDASDSGRLRGAPPSMDTSTNGRSPQPPSEHHQHRAAPSAGPRGEGGGGEGTLHFPGK